MKLGEGVLHCTTVRAAVWRRVRVLGAIGLGLALFAPFEPAMQRDWIPLLYGALTALTIDALMERRRSGDGH